MTDSERNSKLFVVRNSRKEQDKKVLSLDFVTFFSQNAINFNQQPKIKSRIQSIRLPVVNTKNKGTQK